MIKQEEIEIAGNWIIANGYVAKDQTCQRIEMLTRDYLLMVADKGWEKLFKDPSDGRLWELTYPKGEMHGGGPPKLAVTSGHEAKQKYGL